jgi:ankyrin repeat protein
MDTLPLPPRPNLQQYRKRAKDLVRAAKSTDPGAVRAWSAHWLRTLERLRGETASALIQGSFDRALDEIERRVEERSGKTAGERRSFMLADAQFLSDLPALEALLRASPDLVRARSARGHRATLLHYVAANGVEDFRQLTPPNAVAIARSLLEAGAEVDALANTYRGGMAQTTMNLLVSSTHPAEAGLQPALVETLLDFGAAIDGLEDDGSPLMTAVAFGYIEAAETLASRGARIDNVVAAAVLGRVDLVRRMVDEGGGVSPSLVDLYWLALSDDPESHVERAFVWACAYGRTVVVELLLARGVDQAATDHYGMTGLQWAEANGHVDIVETLDPPRLVRLAGRRSG